MDFGYKKYSNSNTYSNASGICWVKHPFDSYKRLQCDERLDAEKVAEQMMKNSDEIRTARGVMDDSDVGTNPNYRPNPFLGSTSTKYDSNHVLTQKEIDSFKQYSDRELSELLSAINMSISNNTELLGMSVTELKYVAPIVAAEYNRRNLSQSAYSDKQKLAAATLSKISSEKKYKDSVQNLAKSKSKRIASNTAMWVGGGIVIIATIIIVFKIVRNKKS